MSGLVDSAHAGSPPFKGGSAHDAAAAPPGGASPPQGSPPADGSPADGRPPLAPSAPRDSVDGEGSRKGWQSARNVLGLMRVTGRFSTLRDLVHTDAYIEPSRLKMVKHLGEVRRACVCACGRVCACLGGGAAWPAAHRHLRRLDAAPPALTPPGLPPRPWPPPAAQGAFAKVQHAQLFGAEGEGGGKGRDVAVKMLRKELLADPAQVKHAGGVQSVQGVQGGGSQALAGCAPNVECWGASTLPTMARFPAGCRWSCL